MQRTVDEIKALRERLKTFGFWYHNLDLGDGIWTNPNHPHGDYPRSRWNLIEPYVPEDCRGLNVLDIGCNAGFFSLEFKKRGASYVLGIDELPESVEQARFAARELGYPDIDYRCASVYDFDRFPDTPRRFDIVIFLGVFYHLRHPLLMLDKLSVLGPRRMFFQTMVRGPAGPIDIARDYPIEQRAIFEDPLYPAMYFVEESFVGDPTNWWMVNENGIKAMLRSAGFTRFLQTENPEVFICDAPTHRPEDYHWSDRRHSVDEKMKLCPLPRNDA